MAILERLIANVLPAYVMAPLNHNKENNTRHFSKDKPMKDL